MTNAAIYCRISKDDEGRELGVTRQREDCEALAARLRLDVVETYVDNDIGASTRSRKSRRPEYLRMLEDARAGRFDVILAYTNSRLTRRPLELEDLIRLYEQHGTRIETVASGRADLSTADGRQYARIQASIDAGEAERTGERVSRKALESAQQGRPVGGPRPFGWAEDRLTLDPIEAGMLRNAADAILSGRTAVAIARDWNDAGVTTPRGNAWSAEGIKGLLRSPRIAGWRVYRYQIAADRNGEPVRGQHEPILDDATWRAVVAALKRPDRRTRIPRRGARHYLLTGLLRCAECGQPMYGAREQRVRVDGSLRTHSYKCQNVSGKDDARHTNSVGASIEEWVSERVIAASELVEAVPVRGEQAPARERIAELNANIAAHEEMIDELMLAYRERTISAAVAFKGVAEMEASRDEYVAERDGLEAEVRTSEPAAVDRAAWERMDTDQRRAVIERWVDVIYVRKPERRSNKIDPTRLDLVWKNRPSAG